MVRNITGFYLGFLGKEGTQWCMGRVKWDCSISYMQSAKGPLGHAPRTIVQFRPTILRHFEVNLSDKW